MARIFYHLYVFHVLVEEGSNKAASYRLGRDPSTISLSTRALEDAFKIKIVRCIRQGRNIGDSLTDEGRQFIAETRPYFEQAKILADLLSTKYLKKGAARG